MAMHKTDAERTGPMVMESMRIYISGPMAGLKDLNHPAFCEAEGRLKARGHKTMNPANSPAGLDYHHYMDISMAMVRCAELVVTLPGAEMSKGARAEVAYALSLNVPVFCLEDFLKDFEGVKNDR